MLKVQEYLKSGKSLEDLTTEYQIGASVCDALGVVSLNYSQIASDLSQTVCQECRGLILELGTWDVVCRSFDKFFNLEEFLNESVRNVFDWSTAKVLDKVDGTLVMMYYYKDKWNYATRKMADANGPVGSYDTTFDALIASTIKEMNFWPDLELIPEVFYSFELTTPLNRIVVPYDGYKLTWLAAWDKDTLQELNIWDLPQLSVPRVKQLPLTNLDEIMEMVGSLSPTEGEGVVVVDGSYRRMKIKSPEYLRAFRAVTTAEASPRNRISILQSEQYDDIYGLLPQALRNDMDILKAKFEALAKDTAATYAELKDIELQKDFALKALAFPYNGWLFQLRKGEDLDSLMRRSSPEKIEEILDKHYSEIRL